MQSVTGENRRASLKLSTLLLSTKNIIFYIVAFFELTLEIDNKKEYVKNDLTLQSCPTYAMCVASLNSAPYFLALYGRNGGSFVQMYSEIRQSCCCECIGFGADYPSVNTGRHSTVAASVHDLR